MGWRHLVIPECILGPEETQDEGWQEHITGVVVAETWEMTGMPVWAEKCVVCGCTLKDGEVDLCSKCEEDYEIE